MPVKSRLVQRWFCLLLGMFAMLGAVVSVPLASTLAFTMSDQSTVMASGTDDHVMAPMSKDMNCAKRASHCPDCPQKSCPDMGSCLVKCFQPLSPLPAEVHLQGSVHREQLMPAPSRVIASSLIPPLLRPPSV